MTEQMELTEKLILIGIRTGDTDHTEASLDELAFLIRTAGAEEAGRVIQNRENAQPGTYIGKGKIDEVKELIWERDATGVVCDDELSPAQMKNLEDLLDTKVLDRTVVILDIFASRARSAEGKIQVELAQLRYSLTRLAGFGASMSRLGGGIGTRGPGETKLETDRRRIRSRISQLKEELSDVVRHREVTRSRRKENQVPVAAIVGYTNAGKSTLINALTGSDVLAENRLFATLDPTTRAFTLPSGETMLLTDTVGFIHKLPTSLIEAFKSTLEEARYADLILHVVDSSDPERDMKMDVVYRTLSELGIEDKPVFTLYNKCDLPDPWPVHRDWKAEKILDISAAHGIGTDSLLSALSEYLKRGKKYLELSLPFSEAGRLQDIRRYGRLLSEEYTEQGITVKAWVPDRLYGKFVPREKEPWE